MSMFNVSHWSDGSLKFASFLLRVPAAVAASGTLTVQVFAGGSAPSASSRTLADLPAMSAEVDGLDYLSGTWVSSLAQGVTDADDIVVVGDGQAGKVWRIRQQFMQSGANHGQMECYWYVAALQDASGNLYGSRVLGRVTQPWYNIDTPTKSWRTMSAPRLRRSRHIRTASRISSRPANSGGAVPAPGEKGLLMGSMLVSI